MANTNLAKRLSAIPTPEESYGALFGAVADEDKIVKLRLCDLEFFPQRTPISSDDALDALAEDIKKVGVKDPILVRTMQPDTGHPYQYFQVLNGRNRTEASRRAGMETIRATIYNCSDEEAQYIVATTTVNQRHDLKPSVKAWAYRAKHDAEKLMSGARTDLVHNVHKVDTLTNIAKSSEDSKRTIAYYIRLTYLTDELMEMVDTGKLPLRAGVALSYLDVDEQDIIHAFVTENRKNISVEQAEYLRTYHEEMGLTIAQPALQNLFFPQAVALTTSKAFVLAKKDLQRIQSIIPPIVQSDKNAAADYIIRALEYYGQCSEGA